MVCSLCLSPLQIVLRIFSFLSKGFKHNTVVLSTLSHLNKTCFHMPMQFPSPTAAIRSMKFWTWEVSLGAVQVQSFDHGKQTYQETDSSPSLSIVHLDVGVSTLFATKVDTFPRDRESMLMIMCSVHHCECGFGKSSYFDGQRWHIL